MREGWRLEQAAGIINSASAEKTREESCGGTTVI